MQDDYTLEELADAAGMTTRNVRAYRTRGLLQPPAREGRRARYDVRHLTRLQEVAALRDAGVPLDVIAAAVARDAPLDPALLASAWLDSSGADAGDRHEVDGSLGSRLRDHARHLDRLVSLGVVHRDGERLYTSAEVHRCVADLVAAGLALPLVLAVAVRTAEAAATLASDIAGEVPPDVAATGALATGLTRLAVGVVRESVAAGLRPV